MKNPDETFMKQALSLAEKGLSWTNPHPLVGAVVVKDGKVIAQGYHHEFGAEHAEADAIMHSIADLSGATLYVTLEPCHLPYDLHGKRIPCYEYILKSGIKKVHIAMLDSNPEVAGKGRVMLEQAGIPTTLGCMGEAALELNKAYHYFMTHHRPLVVRPSAITSTKESSETSSDLEKLRRTCQAVLVDAESVLKTNPDLSCHDEQYQDPIRILLDPDLSVPLTAHLFRDNRVIIATTQAASQTKLAERKNRTIKIIISESEIMPMGQLLDELAGLKIISILIEAGDQTLHVR